MKSRNLGRSLALTAALLVAAHPASAAETFICVADYAAGLAFDKAAKKWKSAIFDPREKLLLSKATPEEAKKGAVWVVKETGSTVPRFVCNEDFNEAGYIYCRGFGDFRFNRKNLRFISTYMIGFVTDGIESPNSIFGNEGENTPSLSAGRCSQI